jgi:hypothetical protein
LEREGDVKDPRVVTFRMVFWRWLLVGWVTAQVFYAALFLLMEVGFAGGRGLRDPAYWAFYAAGAAAVTVLMVPALWLYVLIWRVWVGPDTLCASDVWGRFVTVPWASVRAARPFNLLTLPYLRVFSTETRRVMWLPLFLADYRRFAELVAEYAGADHPVTRAAWQRIEDS